MKTQNYSRPMWMAMDGTGRWSAASSEHGDRLDSSGYQPRNLTRLGSSFDGAIRRQSKTDEERSC